MIPIIKDLGKVCVTPCEVYDEEKEYDILCLVSDELKTKLYVSKKIVPAGTPLEDTDYWSCLLDFDDQLKEYKEFYEEIKDYIEINEERIKEVYDTAFKVWDQDVTEGLDGNMNALLDPGIYAKCYLGRPNPTDNNAFYTLQVLKGEKASPYFEGSGAKIQEIVDNWISSENDTINLNSFSKTGTYRYNGIDYPEHYNTTAIAYNDFGAFSAVLPPGNYRVGITVYPSYTPGRNIPAPTTTPLIILNGVGSGGQLTNDSNVQADYSRTTLDENSKKSHGVFYLSTDENGVLQFTLNSSNAGYNWFVYWVEIEPVAIATGSYDVIPQICMNHANGDIYRRVLYSKELDVDQSQRHFAPPYTLYPKFEAFTDAPELAPIQDNPYSGWEKIAKLKDVKDIKETYRLDEMYDIIFSLSDSDNVINKFNEVKAFLEGLGETPALINLLNKVTLDSFTANITEDDITLNLQEGVGSEKNIKTIGLSKAGKSMIVCNTTSTNFVIYQGQGTTIIGGDSNYETIQNQIGTTTFNSSLSSILTPNYGNQRTVYCKLYNVQDVIQLTSGNAIFIVNPPSSGSYCIIGQSMPATGNFNTGEIKSLGSIGQYFNYTCIVLLTYTSNVIDGINLYYEGVGKAGIMSYAQADALDNSLKSASFTQTSGKLKLTTQKNNNNSSSDNVPTATTSADGAMSSSQVTTLNNSLKDLRVIQHTDHKLVIIGKTNSNSESGLTRIVPVATSTDDGAMAKEDKANLDNIVTKLETDLGFIYPYDTIVNPTNGNNTDINNIIGETLGNSLVDTIGYTYFNPTRYFSFSFIDNTTRDIKKVSCFYNYTGTSNITIYSAGIIRFIKNGSTYSYDTHKVIIGNQTVQGSSSIEFNGDTLFSDVGNNRYSYLIYVSHTNSSSALGTLSGGYNYVGGSVLNPIMPNVSEIIRTDSIIDNAITKAKLNSNVADNVSIELDSTNGLQIKFWGVKADHIDSGAITESKLNDYLRAMLFPQNMLDFDSWEDTYGNSIISDFNIKYVIDASDYGSYFRAEVLSVNDIFYLAINFYADTSQFANIQGFNDFSFSGTYLMIPLDDNTSGPTAAVLQTMAYETPAEMSWSAFLTEVLNRIFNQ